MSDAGPLLVPIAVQAMMLDDPSAPFVRAGMNYGQLSACGIPAPAPFQNDAGPSFATDSRNQGIYLMWTLPAALRHGQRDDGGMLRFPLVPDRWLVVRLVRPANAPATRPPDVAAWVVQGDYLHPSDGSSTYIDPTETATMTPTLLGRKVPISASAPWQEPVTSPPAFLRAVAEGNPAFAAYQPFNENVFSIVDDLVTQNVGAATISYFVLGWYRDASVDALASWQLGVKGKDFGDLLSSLQWSATTPDTLRTTASLYHGASTGIPWTPSGLPSPSPTGGRIPGVAVANGSVDGLAAFARAAFPQWVSPPDGTTPQDLVDLLEAFQYNLLPMLEQPGAESMIEQRIRAQWYGSAQAGTRWTIVNAPVPSGQAPPPAPTPAELAAEAAWLDPLNAAQSALDRAARDRAGLQRELYELWWKKGAATLYQNETGDWPWTVQSAEQFDGALAALAAQVRPLDQSIGALTPGIPAAAPGATLDDAITAFASTHGLPVTRQLKAAAAPRFWSPADPVAVVSNTAHTVRIEPDAVLGCRWPSEIVTTLSVTAAAAGGAAFTLASAQLGTAIPSVPWTGLPATAPALFAEFFLLDPANAALLATAVGTQLTVAQVAAVAASMSPPVPGTSAMLVPAVLPPATWAQPWQPLYFDWEVAWYEIPMRGADGTANWSFDGLDYALLPNPPLPQQVPLLQGRSVLTPKPSFEFRSRLEQFVQDYPASDATKALDALDALLTKVDQWDYLSQALGGLQAQLATWNPVPAATPDTTALAAGGSYAALVGDQAAMPPSPRSAVGPRSGTVPPSSFEGMRAGQLFVNRISVVDAFGRALPIVYAPSPGDPIPRTADRAVFHPLVADGLAPTQAVLSQEPLRFVQLPPRVLQPARLNFDLVAGDSGDPILGWVLPNHIDQGLAAYGPDGTAYGELSLGTDVTGAPLVVWTAAPNSPHPVLPAPADAQTPLDQFLSHLQARGAQALGELLASVDETLWTVDPLGNRADSFLSVLAGRPLALVSATLSLELQGAPWRDTDWPYTFGVRPDPRFVREQYEFPVRLGDLGFREDGMVGYFLNGDYGTFQAIHPPDAPPVGTPSGYIEAVAPGNYVNLGFAVRGPGAPATVTMLVDPRGSVHAQCALFPVKEITIPPEWVDAAMERLALAMRVGPVLVSTRAVVPKGATDAVTTLVFSTPAEQKGSWSWMQQDTAGAWSSMPLTGADGVARAADVVPTLREGVLTLTNGMGG